jgi:hypothetical protein
MNDLNQPAISASFLSRGRVLTPNCCCEDRQGRTGLVSNQHTSPPSPPLPPPKATSKKGGGGGGAPLQTISANLLPAVQYYTANNFPFMHFKKRLSQACVYQRNISKTESYGSVWNYDIL